MNNQSNSDRALRIGAVTYLNTKPLVYGLAQKLPRAELTFDHPSRLADALADGDLDIALVPSAELLIHPEWSIVSDACIGCRGPVLSVKLLFRVLPKQVRTLALDEGSRTSAVLARILLRKIAGVMPRVVSLPLGSEPCDVTADAVLVIGDRAIRTDEADFAEVWDLGDRWCRHTELPFVFAMWAAREGLDTVEAGAALSAARDQGRIHLADIARSEARQMELPYDLVFEYLSRNLHFQLGPRERQGLDLFFDEAAAHGLVPSAVRTGCQ